MSQSPPDSPYDSVNTLFGMLAEAFGFDADALARALEDGSLTLDLTQDEESRRFVVATLKDDGGVRRAKIYRDALYRETGEPS